jgi:tRNA (guanine-N7-)-methyltransferase
MGRIRNNRFAPDELKTYTCVKSIDDNIDLTTQENYLEIGCGKGDFILQKSLLNPNVNFIAIEQSATILLIAVKKYMNAENHNNVTFICGNAYNFLAKNKLPTFNCIYINFPDPWPKKRHEKFRLLNVKFLQLYHTKLVTNGTIEFKTDNTSLFDYAIDVLSQTKKLFDISKITNDLYSDETMMQNNIATEYEKKFVARGQKICKLVLAKK